MKYLISTLFLGALLIATSCYASVLVFINDTSLNVSVKVDPGNYLSKKIHLKVAPHKKLTFEVGKGQLGDANIFYVVGNNLVTCGPLFVFRDYAIVFSNMYNQGLKCYVTELDSDTWVKLK